MSNVAAISWRDQVILNEMMLMVMKSALY